MIWMIQSKFRISIEYDIHYNSKMAFDIMFCWLIRFKGSLYVIIVYLWFICLGIENHFLSIALSWNHWTIRFIRIFFVHHIVCSWQFCLHWFIISPDHTFILKEWNTQTGKVITFIRLDVWQMYSLCINH